MDKTEEQMFLAQYLLKENQYFIDDLEEFSPKNLEVLADNFLIAYFLNERSFINQLLEENKKENTGIKNHYNSFNAEHAMGYELVKRDDGIACKLNRTPFKICDVDDKQLADIMDSVDSMYIGVKLNNREMHGLTPKYKNFDIIGEYKNKGINIPQEKQSSLYDFREMYLYSKKDKAIYFKGNPPRLITKDFKNSYTEEELSKLLNDAYLKDFDTTKQRHTLSLKEAINDLCDAYSHGTYKIVGEYILVKDVKSDFFITYDKCWLKAIAETFVKIKDYSNSPKNIEECLIEYYGKNKSINLQREDGKKSILDFIEQYYGQDENFAINEGTEKYIVNNFSSLADDGKINFKKIKDMSAFLYMIEGVFYKNDCLKGIPFPSKSYLYWLNCISVASSDKKEKEINSMIKNLVLEMKQKKENLLKRYKKPPLNDKNFIELLTQNLMGIMDKYQADFTNTLNFYDNTFIYKIQDLNESLSVQKEMELAVILSSIIAPICKSYDATAIPQQHANELFPSFDEKIKALNNNFEHSNWGDYCRRDLKFDNLSKDEALRLKDEIMKKDWKEYQKTSTVIKGLKGDAISFDLLSNHFLAIPKIINQPKTFQYNSFWVSRIISKLRNAICHSYVYLINDPQDNNPQFLFRTAKSDRDKYESSKKIKESEIEIKNEEQTQVAGEQTSQDSLIENKYLEGDFFSNMNSEYKDYYHILTDPYKIFQFFNNPYFYKKIKPQSPILGIESGDENVRKESLHHFSPNKRRLTFSPKGIELTILENEKNK